MTDPSDSSRNRSVDGVIIQTARKKRLPPARSVSLDGKGIYVVQAKAGVLDLGVLGQTVFSAELIACAASPAEIVGIPAAVHEDSLVASAAKAFDRFELLPKTYPHLTSGSTSEAKDRSLEDRTRMIEAYWADNPGMLLHRPSGLPASAFRNVLVHRRGGTKSLEVLRPKALLLRDRATEQIDVAASVEVSARERIVVIHTCSALYMTFMGRGVFSRAIAHSHLGLTRASSALLFGKTNPSLACLLKRYSGVNALPYPAPPGR